MIQEGIGTSHLPARNTYVWPVAETEISLSIVVSRRAAAAGRMASQGSVKAAAAMLNTVQARVPHKAASLVGKPASSELPEHRNKTTRGIIDTYAYFICPGTFPRINSYSL